MDGLFEPNVDYTMVDLSSGAAKPQRGFQVGLLAVRATGNETRVLPNGARQTAAGMFALEHWQARRGFVVVRSLTTALVLADELSITVPEIKNPLDDQAVDAVLRPWCATFTPWIMAVVRADSYGLPIASYRQWLSDADVRERVA
jgi:hypothetical protein